jgi:hypothetical protein
MQGKRGGKDAEHRPRFCPEPVWCENLAGGADAARPLEPARMLPRGTGGAPARRSYRRFAFASYESALLRQSRPTF